MINDGFQLKVTGDFGYMAYGEHEFAVKHLLIHHPSEHTFGSD